MTAINSTSSIANPFQSTITIGSELKETLNQIDKLDLRTSFKQAQDPIHLAFNYIDKQPLEKIAKDFVKDSIFDIVEFVTGIFE